MRIVFVNLHGNEFLVKTLNKIVFKQSVAIKHKYFLDYLLKCPDVEVCSYINKKGFSMSYSHAKTFKALRFIEHRIALRCNHIDTKKITILKKESEIQKDDIVILYRYYNNQLDFDTRPDALLAISMIHFGTAEAEILKRLQPDVMYNEANFQHGSKIFEHFYSWFDKKFITIPFVFASRFKLIVPFKERKNMAVSVGTVTYMQNIVEIYGNACAQPARKQIKDHAEELKDIIECRNSDYAEKDNEKSVNESDNYIIRIYKQLYNKFFVGHQKNYYSFNMVDKFNEYKMCIVGEEIMGIPGVGFVEGMACGCAYIGQNIGYYEDYGLKEGVHYIGYDGSLKDLRYKIEYYQQPNHQQELELIAKNGYEYVHKNFNGEIIAKRLLEQLIAIQKER